MCPVVLRIEKGLTQLQLSVYWPLMPATHLPSAKIGTEYICKQASQIRAFVVSLASCIHFISTQPTTCQTTLKVRSLSDFSKQTLKVKTFKYLGSLFTNQNAIHEEIKCGLKA